MSLATQRSTTLDPAFTSRVAQAVVTTAVSVASEATDTTNYANRRLLASRMLLQLNDDFARKWAAAVVADGTTDATAADSALTARVAALWNAFAG